MHRSFAFFDSCLYFSFHIYMWLLKFVEKWARYPYQLSDLLGETGIMEGSIAVNKWIRFPWSLTIKQNHSNLWNGRMFSFSYPYFIFLPFCLFWFRFSLLEYFIRSLCIIWLVSSSAHIRSYFFSLETCEKINDMAYVLWLS